MKGYKKILAGVLATSMVMGSSVVVLADEGRTTGSGKVEGSTSDKVFRVELPTIAENDDTFDYIIIAVQERKTAWEIRNSLINKYGIDKRKIIPFSIYAKSEIVENFMLDQKDMEGIILGNSHAYHGILPSYLDGQFVNLSCPSQGIYHNYKVFQKYCTNITENLKYVVFDLYDYNIFNSDISLTKGLFDYIYWGGGKVQGELR